MNITKLLNAMSRHQGCENGISAEHLAIELDVNQRSLRKLIGAAREDGFAICGMPHTGYYMPTTPEELNDACKFLEARALHSLRSLSRMKKVALPELLGQLNLNQA